MILKRRLNLLELAGRAWVAHLHPLSWSEITDFDLRAYLSYTRSPDELRYWRSIHGQEVDYLIGDHTAVEVKSTRRVSPKDTNGLRTLAEEKIFKNFYLVSQDRTATTSRDVSCLPWETFLKRLWEGKISGNS